MVIILPAKPESCSSRNQQLELLQDPPQSPLGKGGSVWGAIRLIVKCSHKKYADLVRLFVAKFEGEGIPRLEWFEKGFSHQRLTGHGRSAWRTLRD